MGVKGLRSQGFYREEVIAPIKIVWPHKVDDRVCHDLFPYSHNYTVNPWDSHKVILSFLHALSCLATRSPSLARTVPFLLMRFFWCVVPRLSTLVFPSEDKISYDWLLHCHLRKKKVHWRLTAILLSESSYESNNNSCYRLRRTGTWIFH